MTRQARIVVVGGGLAGLSAAIEADRNGAAVVLIDKEPRIGGNSAKATSGINGMNTAAQSKHNITDAEVAFKKDTVSSGGGLSVESLVEVLVVKSKSAHEFLAEFGLNLEEISQCGGHSVPRTHREPAQADGRPSPVGWNIIKAVKGHIDAGKTGIKIINDARATRLIQNDAGHVVGVEYVSHNAVSTLEADAVILATGGFSFDRDSADSLLRKYAPQLAELPTTNGAFATGDGIRIGQAVNADLVDMEQVQVHPTGFVDPANPFNPVKFLAPEALRGCGAVLLNGNGVRFANELTLRDALSAAILAHGREISAFIPPLTGGEPQERKSRVAYILLNDEMGRGFGMGALDFYKSKGLVKTFADAASVAAFIGCAPEAVRDTLTRYEQSAQAGADEFGKTVFPVKQVGDGPFHVAVITPSLHYTMGGLRINGDGQVLRRVEDTFKPIPRLFAAGEVTGGVHGKNRLAGNSLLECVVFGRTAGARAAAVVLSDEPAFKGKDVFVPLKLRDRECLSTYTRLFRFDLPSPLHTTGFDVGQYISTRAKIDGQDIIRYYSPCNRPDDYGVLELLIKVDDKGVMSHYFESLRPGDVVEFSGPLGDLHIDFARKKHIGLVCGGTGISPMLQIIRKVLHELPEHPDVTVKLLWGAMVETELVYRDRLEANVASHPQQIGLYFVLNNPPANWTQGTGFINEKVLREQLPAPADDTMIVMCGPPGMCKALKPAFEKIGYTKDNFFSFM